MTKAIIKVNNPPATGTRIAVFNVSDESINGHDFAAYKENTESISLLSVSCVGKTNGFTDFDFIDAGTTDFSRAKICYPE